MILYSAFKFHGNISKSALDLHVEHPLKFSHTVEAGQDPLHTLPPRLLRSLAVTRSPDLHTTAPSPKAGSAPGPLLGLT